jgi:hypothetical protein
MSNGMWSLFASNQHVNSRRCRTGGATARFWIRIAVVLHFVNTDCKRESHAHLASTGSEHRVRFYKVFTTSRHQRLHRSIFCTKQQGLWTAALHSILLRGKVFCEKQWEPFARGQ